MDNLETLVEELIVAAKHAGWAYGSDRANIAAMEAKDRLMDALRKQKDWPTEQDVKDRFESLRKADK